MVPWGAFEYRPNSFPPAARGHEVYNDSSVSRWSHNSSTPLCCCLRHACTLLPMPYVRPAALGLSGARVCACSLVLLC